MSSQLAAQAALLPGEKLKSLVTKKLLVSERNDGDPETLYTEFQPDFEMEVYLNDDFLK